MFRTNAVVCFFSHCFWQFRALGSTSSADIRSVNRVDLSLLVEIFYLLIAPLSLFIIVDYYSIIIYEERKGEA